MNVVFEVEAESPEASNGAGRLNFPNVLSFIRLLGAVLLLLFFVVHQTFSAGVLLGILGSTDWIDGWWARKFDQRTDFGAKLDPVADRAVMILGGIGAVIDGRIPRPLIVLVLVREVVLSCAVVARVMHDTPLFRVSWPGKIATCLLLMSFCTFLLLEPTVGFPRSVAGWCLGLAGVGFSWYSAWRYLTREGSKQ